MGSEPLTDALRETLAVFDGSGEPRTTPEVADRLDLGRRSAYARLDRLVERGRLETKKVGANARVWWRPPDDGVPVEPAEAIERISDGFFAVDDEWTVTYANDASAELFDSDREELLGERLWDAFPGLSGTEFEAAYREVMASQEPDSVEAYYAPFDGWYLEAVYPSPSGLSIYTRDVTERKRHERELKTYERLIETIGDGIYVLDGDSRFTIVNDAFTSMTGHDRTDLLGVRAELVFGEKFVDVANEKQAELESESRDVAVLEEVLYGADDTPFVVESRFALFEFGGGETGRVGVVRDVTDRVEYERDLEHQRDQLAAVNSLHELVAEVVDAITGQSTREEIEARVCEFLADSDSYRFAWIGDADATTQLVTPRVAAGTEGYLEDVTISVDPDDDRGDGPTGRAFRTGETQTSRDILRDPEYEPWRTAAREHGFRSSAAVPIVHEGAVYGVLNVYADRPHAFEGHEGAVIAQLGQIVGHAIAAAERKRVLLSDELVELEFQIRDVFADIDGSVRTAGTITFDNLVALSGDAFLVYGTATPDAVDTVIGLSDALAHWDELAVRPEGDPVGFELRLSDPPVLPVIASLGGYVDGARIEDGDFQITVHLAPDADVNRVVDAVEAEYPKAVLLSHRQLASPQIDPRQLRNRFVVGLTDRQRAALTAAYHAGFYEWPREKSGEEIAGSLDVAPPTFYQHLRKGEHKVFDSLFSLSDGRE